MKRKLFLFLGALCLFVFYSCQKSMKDSNRAELNQSSSVQGSKIEKEHNPASLVAGTLDTIQKGFGFTEGPAVDKFGNVFFTDQPNDKIYRWDATTSEITLFLQGTGQKPVVGILPTQYFRDLIGMHPIRWRAANNVFAGLNEKTLFITGRVDRITSIKMNVKGVERFDGEHKGYGNH